MGDKHMEAACTHPHTKAAASVHFISTPHLAAAKTSLPQWAGNSFPIKVTLFLKSRYVKTSHFLAATSRTNPQATQVTCY